MLIQNAINHAIGLPAFTQKVKKSKLNVNACRGIDVKLVADTEQQIHFYEMYFDFGNVGPSIHDIRVRLKLNGDGSFTVLHFQ